MTLSRTSSWMKALDWLLMDQVYSLLLKKKKQKKTLSARPRISKRLLFREYFGKSRVRDAILGRGVG